jgi:hypothetical protein
MGDFWQFYRPTTAEVVGSVLQLHIYSVVNMTYYLFTNIMY